MRVSRNLSLRARRFEKGRDSDPSFRARREGLGRLSERGDRIRDADIRDVDCEHGECDLRSIIRADEDSIYGGLGARALAFESGSKAGDWDLSACMSICERGDSDAGQDVDVNDGRFETVPDLIVKMATACAHERSGKRGGKGRGGTGRNSTRDEGGRGAGGGSACRASGWRRMAEKGYAVGTGRRELGAGAWKGLGRGVGGGVHVVRGAGGRARRSGGKDADEDQEKGRRGEGWEGQEAGAGGGNESGTGEVVWWRTKEGRTRMDDEEGRKDGESDAVRARHPRTGPQRKWMARAAMGFEGGRRRWVQYGVVGVGGVGEYC
ncbi:hypothetical protein DFH09DRAFT_1086579 [Mycena vulgaris]|nr:hypothetical protein DFH09DRAFT_1086579 [Mycena vulgaris]